ncbi:lipoprotein ABC transporter [Tepiditoga spiralis]|uniref:Lipoprotein ABC transporter n=1 Tax=Tepiditoga spiralis TaxID=2108365 RepID=A0A7G1G8S4_9BACT|nr:FtsX-like permease family protein [Tepiditoga spiralis]BBE31644.1 lipoprotein ABC transporter [Tepiditoga spiralis]
MNNYINKAINTVVKGFLKKAKKNFNFSFFSILIGVWGLIVITSVINGFDTVLIKSITNFYPHLTINGKYKEKLPNELYHFEFNLNNSMISKNGKYDFIQLLELDNTEFYDSLIISGNSKNGVVIGNELAKKLYLKVGNTLNLFELHGFLPISKNYTVSGIFKSGVYQFDSKIAFLKDTSKKKFTGIILKDPKKAFNLKEKYLKNYSSLTWKESNSSLTKTVEVDSLFAFLITLFVFLMSGFSISNSITFSIITRKREIGIFKSLGMTSNQISKIFIREGLIISTYGYLSGLFLGLITSLIISFLKIPLPKGIFYVDYLPISININIVFISLLVTFITVYIFSFFTTRKILKFDTLEALKNGE